MMATPLAALGQLQVIPVDSYCVVCTSSSQRISSGTAGAVVEAVSPKWRIARVIKAPEASDEFEGIVLDVVGDVHTLYKTFLANERKQPSPETSTSALPLQAQLHGHGGTHPSGHHGGGVAVASQKQQRQQNGSSAAVTTPPESETPASVPTSFRPQQLAALRTTSSSSTFSAFHSFTEAVIPGSGKDVMFHVGILDQIRTSLARGGLHNIAAMQSKSPMKGFQSTPSKQVQRTSLLIAAVGSILPKQPQQPSSSNPPSAAQSSVVVAPRAKRSQLLHTTQPQSESGLRPSPSQPPLARVTPLHSLMLDDLLPTANSSAVAATATSLVDLGGSFLSPQSVDVDIAIFSTPSDPLTMASRMQVFSRRDILCFVPHIVCDVTVTCTVAAETGGGRSGNAARHISGGKSPMPNSGGKKKPSVRIDDPDPHHHQQQQQQSPSQPSFPSHGSFHNGATRASKPRLQSNASKSIIELQGPAPPQQQSSLGRMGSARGGRMQTGAGGAGDSNTTEEVMRAVLVDPKLIALIPAMLHAHSEQTKQKAASLQPALLTGDEVVAHRLTRSVLRVFQQSSAASEREVGDALRRVKISFYTCEILDDDAAQLADVLMRHGQTLEEIDLSTICHPALSTDFTRVVPEAELSSMLIDQHKKKDGEEAGNNAASGTGAGDISDDKKTLLEAMMQQQQPSLLSKAPISFSTRGSQIFLRTANLLLHRHPQQRNVLSKLVLRHLALDDAMIKQSLLLSAETNAFVQLRYLDLSYNGTIGDETLLACLNLLNTPASPPVLETLLLAGNVISDRGALDVQHTFLSSPSAPLNALALRTLDLRRNTITELVKDTVLAPVSVPRQLMAWSREHHQHCDRRVRRRVVLVWMILDQRRSSSVLATGNSSFLPPVDEAVQATFAVPSSSSPSSSLLQRAINRRKKRAAAQGIYSTDDERLLSSFASYFALFNRTSPIHVLF